MVSSITLPNLVKALFIYLSGAAIALSTTCLPSVRAGNRFMDGKVSASSVHFVRLPAGTILQVVLQSSVDPSSLSAQETLEASTTSDTTLSNGGILRAGTRLFATVTPTTEKESLLGSPVQVVFNRMQLHDGTGFPISARILEGGRAIDSLIVPDGKKRTLARGYRLRLQMDAPAQIAVMGAGTAM